MDCGGRPLDLSRPQVMGILNITPDSFSDGGRYYRCDDALAQARRMVDAGAAIIDVGGESTRPGATPVTVAEELDRVIPVIEAISAELAIPVSIDTSKPEVMQAAVAAGAGMINDVRALTLEGALAAAVACAVPVCLMHMQGQPQSMQAAPNYQDVVQEVQDYLVQRVAQCVSAGIPHHNILIDPGFGFGKQLAHNLQLMSGLAELVATGLPVLIGVSRKSMIGHILDNDVNDRLLGSVTLAALAVWQGCHLIRAHDVQATYQAIQVVMAVKNASHGLVETRV